MQTLTKSHLKADTNPLIVGGAWNVFPAALSGSDDTQVDAEMRAALLRAETVIRAQEDRIRVLENLAQTDELTGLGNRRAFVAAFERELSLARRDTAHDGILVLVDLDGFKAVNDQWGHATGDAYLRAVAQALTQGVRSSDVVARLGGDEFAVLFTNMDKAAGQQRMARLEQFLHARSLMHGRLPLRASFGCAAYNGSMSTEAVMQVADTRLYAKKARNKKLATAGAAG